MKRDWDLIREQLLAIEAGPDVATVRATLLGDMPMKPPSWEDGQSEAGISAKRAEYEAREERVFGHLQLLLESRYIDGIHVKKSPSGTYGFAVVSPRLTMAGHDLLDTMRSKPIWESIKSTAKAKGLELTFDTIKVLAGIAIKSFLT